MSLLSTVAMAAVGSASPFTTPAWIFPVIAATVFVALGFVMWSFRDVANRHSYKADRDSGASHH
jgi:heme/copper-type cytochrome/quinol oxidase subunit 2